MNRRHFITRSSLLAAAPLLSPAQPAESLPSAGPGRGAQTVTSAVLAEEMRAGLGARLQPQALRPAADFDDPVYHKPTRTEVETVFRARTTLRQPWSVEIFDCDDFAYSLRVDFARYRYRTIVPPLATPFAVGLLWGTDFPGVGKGVHVVNLAATSDAGLLLLDATPESGGIQPVEAWQGIAKYVVI